MANARFLYDNLFWGASTSLTTTVGAWLLTRPLSFLFSPWRKKVARSVAATTSVDIIINFGSAKIFNGIFLINPKVHTGGSVVIQANNTNSWGSPAFTSAAFPAVDLKRKLTGLFFAQQTYQYVRVWFKNDAGVNEYIELGTIVIGNYYEPTYNITDRLTINRHDPSRIVVAYDGERQSHRLTKYDDIDGELEAMPEADKDTFLSMYDQVGTDTPLVFAIDSAVLSKMYYGYLADEVSVDYHVGSLDLWDIDVALEEAR
jgi:hypothetical protein